MHACVPTPHLCVQTCAHMAHVYVPTDPHAWAYDTFSMCMHALIHTDTHAYMYSSELPQAFCTHLFVTDR